MCEQNPSPVSGGEVLPMMAYTGRHRPKDDAFTAVKKDAKFYTRYVKGVPFVNNRYTKGVPFS